MARSKKRLTAEERAAIKRRNRRRYIIAFIVLILGIAGALYGILKLHGAVEQKVAGPMGPKTTTVTVFCSGDLVIHNAVEQAAQTNGTHDFKPTWRYVKDRIQKADYAFVCSECALTGPPYSGYPTFHIPEVLAKNLADVGYDTVIQCSNHTADNGETGVFHSYEVYKKAGLSVAGVRGSEKDPRYTMTEVNGVKIALVAYTYGGGQPDNRDLNGNPLTDKANKAINSFSYGTFDSVEFQQIKDTVQAARDAGAQAVIMYVHWGEEYQSHSNSEQQHVADKLAKGTDIDIIIGSHPHNPQEFTTIDRSKSKFDYTGADIVPVYYSMGNVLSNQRREMMGDLDPTGETEEGYFVELKFVFADASGKLLALQHEPIPYWLDMAGSGTSRYTIIPLTKGYEDNEFLKSSGHVNQAKAAKKSLEKILAGKGSE